MLVNEYASALYTVKDYITCGNITDSMFIVECNNTRFSLGELDTNIEFYAYLYYLTKSVYMYIYMCFSYSVNF